MILFGYSKNTLMPLTDRHCVIPKCILKICSIFLNSPPYGLKNQPNIQEKIWNSIPIDLKNQPFNKFKTIFKNQLIEDYNLYS